MPLFPITNLHCECGHPFIIVPPGFPADLQYTLSKKGKVSVYTANRTEATCPVCSRTHRLPRREILDDRSAAIGWMRGNPSSGGSAPNNKLPPS